MSEPPIPIKMVNPTLMGSGPGSTSRPSAPTIKPESASHNRKTITPDCYPTRRVSFAFVAYWLLKTEPDAFSIDDLERKGTSSWDGVRNYQARNNLLAMK